MTEEEFRTGKKGKKESMIALSDYHLFCPPHVDLKIKKGDDVSEFNLEKKFIDCLITERILKG